MAKSTPEPIVSDSADETIALQMARWLSHLGSERRLSPKTLEAYGRDLRQCLDFLCEHFGTRVTLSRFAGLETADVRAFMAMRRADEIGGRSLMRTLAGLRSFGRFLEREGMGKVGALAARACRSRSRCLRQNASPMPTSVPAKPARAGSWRAMPP